MFRAISDFEKSMFDLPLLDSSTSLWYVFQHVCFECVKPVTEKPKV